MKIVNGLKITIIIPALNIIVNRLPWLERQRLHIRDTTDVQL